MKREITWTLSNGKQGTVTVELVTKKTLDADGEWVSTPYQVADFHHDRDAAIRRIINDYLT